ncbi:alpha/beta hydrolase [Sphingomonas sp. Leaf412]|uniref:hydrolase 1, exosortase A system-associated n=1 Tax=Sphingomonas sp. Leaf412 TaxID=1736370 RepID=UPI0007008AFB|nr:hydrolase 1, exosortase A system-associated [Sphingomonas sp. Leaf412]KQT33511.1 alpha/beta hydrolase [Sphingomonas sp. Leaf412]
MRRVIAFPCAGETLLGTLDEGRGDTGLLIVSGGNEIRAGAHRGMALLAARLAADNIPVLRYDRRGVGDSPGANVGQPEARADLAAALAAFRAEAGVARVVGFGNCDAATLLAIEGRALGIDAVVLANPWTGDERDALPPAAAIRAGYAAKLRRPDEWRRLLSGGVDLAKFARGLAKLARGAPPPPLAPRVVRAIDAWGDAATVVLAAHDATAIAFAAARGPGGAATIVPTASHSFARANDAAALEAAIRRVVRR